MSRGPGGRNSRGAKTQTQTVSFAVVHEFPEVVSDGRWRKPIKVGKVNKIEVVTMEEKKPKSTGAKGS